MDVNSNSAAKLRGGSARKALARRQSIGFIRAGVEAFGRPFIGCVDGIALTAIKAVVSEGRLIKAAAVIRASDLARRWVFLAAGVHLNKLGSF
jgi:hypothetical protein